MNQTVEFQGRRARRIPTNARNHDGPTSPPNGVRRRGIARAKLNRRRVNADLVARLHLEQKPGSFRAASIYVGRVTPRCRVSDGGAGDATGPKGARLRCRDGVEKGAEPDDAQPATLVEREAVEERVVERERIERRVGQHLGARIT